MQRFHLGSDFFALKCGHVAVCKECIKDLMEDGMMVLENIGC